MAILKVKNTQGEWQSIPAFKGDKGDPGKDGAIQYTAGEGIKIEDNIISATGNGNGLKGVYVVDAPQLVMTGASYGNRENYSEMFTDFENAINKAIADGYKYPILIVNAKNATYLLECKQMYVGSNGSITFTSPINTNNENQIGLTSYTINYKIGFYGTWTDNIYTITSISTYKGEMKIVRTTEVLMRDNTSSFTPTKDYHPATKKYVDDAIKTTLGGSY